MRIFFFWLFGLVMLLVAICSGLAFFYDQGWPPALDEKISVSTFLERHWSDPLPPQGPVPDGFSDLEASLAPKDCGSCHPRQFEDWRTSKHARAMGLGISWQLPLLGQQEGNRCLRCHAPLAEQKALTAQRLGWSNAPDSTPPPHIPADLDLQGLVCAACHMRGQRLYGPPARAEVEQESPVHGGFQAHSAFEQSRFCAHCHQFPDDGPRVNGKLLEDTYAQWLASDAARQNTQCQDCHMPDRRHLWRGIHDPEMVRRALEVDLALMTDDEGRRRLELNLRNVGAGHQVPTYLVPKLVVEVELERRDAPPLLLAKRRVGWYVETDLKTERFDTRIPPGESRLLVFPLTLQDLPSDAGLVVRLEVQPREHYERMFLQVLADPNLSEQNARSVKAALAEARAAHYRLLTKRVPIPNGR
jgi:hypothetical protein